MPHWTVCPAAGTQWTDSNEKQGPGGSLVFNYTWQQDAATAGSPNAGLCDGPTVSATIKNTCPDAPMYASLSNTSQGARQVQFNPGYSRTTSNTQALAALGLTTRSDCAGIHLSDQRDTSLPLVVAT